MRISDRYIGRQVLFGTVYSVVALSLIFVLGTIYQRVEEIFTGQPAPLDLVGRLVLSILPFSLTFTIPWGFLAAVLLVFGRLSSENEFVGMRMAGISLQRLALPVFLIAAALSALCFYLNVAVAPHAKASGSEILYETIRKNPQTLLNPGVAQSQFKNQKVFVESKQGEILKGFHLYQIPADPTAAEAPPTAYVHAGEVALVVDQKKQLLRLTLTDAYFETWNKDGPPEMALMREAEPWLFDFSRTARKKERASQMGNAEIRAALDDPTSTLTPERRADFRAQISQRYAFSFACLALACVGIPLGINARRKDTSSGLAISMGMGAGYFLFTILADEFRGSLGTAADIFLWMPNVLCVAIGYFLFRRSRFK
jgi:lipopolysaccharide export LptBFGC system permease protein LptF